MGRLISMLLFFIGFVSSTQLIAKYWNVYLLFDDVLLLLLVILGTIDFVANNSFSKTNVVLAIALTGFFTFSFVVNFYSFNAFLVKSLFYLKPLVVFVFIGYLSKKYVTSAMILWFYRLSILICLFAWIEFYYIQFVDFSALKYFSPAVRTGIYRASSITWHPISLALLGLISILIGKEIIKDGRRWPYLIFFGAIVLSGTRFVIFISLVYFLYRYLTLRKFRFHQFHVNGKRVFFFIWPFLFLVIFSLSSYITIRDQNSLRSVTFTKGLPLLVDDPRVLVVGSGIGSFGSFESVVYDSPVYKKIGFPEHYKTIMLNANKRSGTENFFFMALVELGLIGLLLYFCLLLRISGTKITTFFAFYVLLVLSFSLVYPLNALPYLYLVNIFFPYGKKQLFVKN